MNEKQLTCKEVSELFNLLCELLNKGKENTEEFLTVKQMIINSSLYKNFIRFPLSDYDKKTYRDKFEYIFGTQNNFFKDKFTIVNSGDLNKIFIDDNKKDYLKVYFIDVNSIDPTKNSNLGLLFRFTDKKNLYTANKYDIANDTVYFLDNNDLKKQNSTLNLKNIAEKFRSGLGKMIADKTKNPYITEIIGFTRSDVQQHSFTTDINIEVICICENKNEYSEVNDMKLSLAFQTDVSNNCFWDMGDLRP